MQSISDSSQRGNGGNQAAADEERYLHNVCPRHWCQTAIDGVGSRYKEKDENDGQQCEIDLYAQ